MHSNTCTSENRGRKTCQMHTHTQHTTRVLLLQHTHIQYQLYTKQTLHQTKHWLLSYLSHVRQWHNQGPCVQITYAPVFVCLRCGCVINV